MAGCGWNTADSKKAPGREALYPGRKDTAVTDTIKPILTYDSSEMYGIPKMSLTEEMNLPAAKKQTLSNKVEMISKYSLAHQALDQIRSRARQIPLIDDQEHADAVQEMYDLFMQAYDLLWKAATHGMH